MYIDVITTTIPCMKNFMNHWSTVQATLGVNDGIVLPGNYELVAFTDHVAAVEIVMAQHGQALETLQLAYKIRDEKRLAVWEAMRRFRFLVQYHYDGLNLSLALPSLPGLKVNTVVFDQKCYAFESVWTLLAEAPRAGLPEPLVLSGGYTLANFSEAILAYKASTMSIVVARQAATVLRATREKLVKEQIKLRLKQYRTIVHAKLPTGNILLDTMPRLSPEPGPQPDKVRVQAVWNPTTQKAELSWSASDRPDLRHYEIRGCNNAPYHGELEFQIATVDKDTLTWQGDEGLFTAGSLMSYKVYVVTTGHRERGSNYVKVQRPEDLEAAA